MRRGRFSESKRGWREFVAVQGGIHADQWVYHVVNGGNRAKLPRGQPPEQYRRLEPQTERAAGGKGPGNMRGIGEGLRHRGREGEWDARRCAGRSVGRNEGTAGGHRRS